MITKEEAREALADGRRVAYGYRLGDGWVQETGVIVRVATTVKDAAFVQYDGDTSPKLTMLEDLVFEKGLPPIARILPDGAVVGMDGEKLEPGTYRVKLNGRGFVDYQLQLSANRSSERRVPLGPRHRALIGEFVVPRPKEPDQPVVSHPDSVTNFTCEGLLDYDGTGMAGTHHIGAGGWCIDCRETASALRRRYGLA